MIVVVGLMQRDDRFLVQKRPAGPFAGLFEFPGGKREVGELLTETLRREWLEELGVEIKVGELVAEAVLDFPETDDYDVLLPLFRVGLIGTGLPEPCIGQELHWMTLREICAVPGTPATDVYLSFLLTRTF